MLNFAYEKEFENFGVVLLKMRKVYKGAIR